MTDIEYEILPARDYIARANMPHFNAADLAYLQYVVVDSGYFVPAEDSIGFEGKIWLLVDRNSASASNLAAAMAINTGFATVVGENTSGVMGPVMSYIVLPNTGIIWRMDIGYFTDDYGRSLEVYGITPQIHTQMDALAIVLMAITAGDY